MSNSLFDNIRSEISQTQQRRHKIDILKIAFVTVLLGFGAVKISNITSFYQTLYLAPLVAVFFDFLTMGEHYSIRRMGAFLRLHSENKNEREYQKFVSENRDKFFKLGARGFTILSFVAAVALLMSINGKILIEEWIWFLGVLVLYVGGIIFGSKRLKDFDKLELPPKTKNPQ